MVDKNQKMMFSDPELSLLNSVFSGNEELIYSIRNVFLQFELSEEDKKGIKGFVTPELLRVLRKRIFPELSADVPLGQLSDFSYSTNLDLKNKNVDDMYYSFEAKQMEIDYLEQQFQKLGNLEAEETIKLNDLGIIRGKTNVERYIQSTARNFLISHIDTMLIHIRMLAGQPKESIEETKKRLERDSSK